MADNEQAAIVPVEQRTIDFYGDELVAVRDEEGAVWVPVASLCEAIGVARSGQIERIQRDPVLSEGIGMCPVRRELGGTQLMTCLSVKYARAWLLGINVSRVNPELRGRLIAYQRELIDMVDRHAGDSLLSGGDQKESRILSREASGTQDKGFIYLLRSGDGYHKIGKSRRPRNRAKMLATNSPFPAELIHLISVDNMTESERYLHERFADKRMNGEWFALAQDEVAWLTSLEAL